MKVTVIGSHLCPDTLYALNKLVEAKADITFQNLSASLPDLKAYLALRESSPVFEGPKAKGSLGIPCFVREDGTWSRCSTEWMRAAANKPSPQKDSKGKITVRVVFHVGSNDFSNRSKGSKSPAACRKHVFNRLEGSGPRWGRSLVRFYRSLRHRSSRDSRRTAT